MEAQEKFTFQTPLSPVAMYPRQLLINVWVKVFKTIPEAYKANILHNWLPCMRANASGLAKLII
ncbi:hypothetical protein ACXYMU_16855 [Pontibacter sp. CAU 1760]